MNARSASGQIVAAPNAAQPPLPAHGGTRRTSHVTSGAVDGFDGAGDHRPRQVLAACRDVAVVDGGVTVVAAAAMRVSLDAGSRITDVTATRAGPDRRGDEPVDASPLVGLRAGPGLRREAVAVAGDATGPLATVLMDLPIAGALSQYARLQTGRHAGESAAAVVDEDRIRNFVDSCAGWAEGGPVVDAVRAGTYTRPEPPPKAPTDEDLAGWHDLGPIPPAWIQRRRRIDLHPLRDGHLVVDAGFRDTWHGPDGTHRALHEWELTVVVGAEHLDVRSVSATPRSLPFAVCPGVTRNLDAVVGVPLEQLRHRTRASLDGPGGCTHLNDLLVAIPAVVARGFDR